MLFVDLPILSIVIAVFVLSRIIPTFMKINHIFSPHAELNGYFTGSLLPSDFGAFRNPDFQ